MEFYKRLFYSFGPLGLAILFLIFTLRTFNFMREYEFDFKHSSDARMGLLMFILFLTAAIVINIFAVLFLLDMISFWVMILPSLIASLCLFLFIIIGEYS